MRQSPGCNLVGQGWVFKSVSLRNSTGGDERDEAFRRFAAETATGLARLAYLLCGGVVPERPDESADPIHAVGSSQLKEVLRGALARVPARQRAAVVLRYFAQLSVTETAAVPRCSEGTVKSQTARGLATLRTAMTELGAGEFDEEMSF